MAEYWLPEKFPENINTHPRKVIGNSEGEGVAKAKFFQGKYEAKLETPGGGVGCFSNQTSSVLGWGGGYGYIDARS